MNNTRGQSESKTLHDFHNNNLAPGILVEEVPVSYLSEKDREEEKEYRRLDGIRVSNSINQIIYYTNDHELKNIIKGKKVQLIEVKRRLNRSVIGQVLIGRDLFIDRYGHSDVEMVILTRIKKYNASLYKWCVLNDIKINPE